MKVVDKTDHWVLPSREEPQVPLSVVEVAYQAIYNVTTDSIVTPSSVSEDSNETYLLAQANNSTYSYDCLDMLLPFNEAMIGPKKICEDLHHKSFFLLELNKIENLEFHVRLSEGIDLPVNPFA